MKAVAMAHGNSLCHYCSDWCVSRRLALIGETSVIKFSLVLVRLNTCFKRPSSKLCHCDSIISLVFIQRAKRKTWKESTVHCSFFSYYDVVLTHSELPARTLSEILAPSSLMVGRKFELNVDEWKFVGHPFSAQTVSFTTACNVIFILQVNVFDSMLL